MGVTVAIQDARVMPSGGVSEGEAAQLMPQDYDGSISRIHRFMRRRSPPLPPAQISPAQRRISAWSMHGCRCPSCRALVRDSRRAQAATLLATAAAAATGAPKVAIGCVLIFFAMGKLEGWMLDGAASPAQL